MKKDKKEKKVISNSLEEVDLNIRDEDVWSYQIEGLAAPRIGKTYSHYKLKKVIFVAVIIVAVSLSLYFSIRTVQKESLEYESVSEGTYELVKFSNTGFVTKMDVDFVSEIVYDKNNNDPQTNFSFKKDETKPVSVIHEYAFNCDDKLEVIRIGKDVEKIDGKSFYTCNNLKQILVDDENEYYCDVDGVLYTKDMKELICYPINHDAYRAEKCGYKEEILPEDEKYEQYKKDVLTYVVPKTVEKIGKLCFNYATLTDVYLPEGLKTIETLSFFRATSLSGIYTYIEDVTASTVYKSLPEGLEYIGSDAFSYNQAMTYVYIPSSVTYIGHHAFWDTVYKEDGELKGVTCIDIGISEDDFSKNVHCGDQWAPQYDHNLFKKTVDINYSATRK